MRTGLAKLAGVATVLAVALAATAAAAGPRYLIGVGLTQAEEGVAVSHVEQGSPAAQAALRPGDRILSVNQSETTAPEQVASALQNRETGVSLLHVKRGETAFFAPVRPELWPDAERDAALFPYAEKAEDAPRSALAAQIAGREYPVLESGQVFNWTKMLGVDAPTGRVAFRARLTRCDDLGSLRGIVQQPGAGLLYPIEGVRSPLFDFDVAQAEKAACDAYMEAHDLSWSSPRVVIAGRFVDDREGRVSDGGVVLLVDAALFDHGHVTLGEQLWSAFELVESVGLLGE